MQNELVVGEMRLDAAVLQRLRRLDVLLVELGEERRAEFLPLATLARPAGRAFAASSLKTLSSSDMRRASVRHSGRRAKRASPESILPRRAYWIPASRAWRGPGMTSITK